MKLRTVAGVFLLVCAAAAAPSAWEEMKPYLPQFEDVVITGDIDGAAVSEIQAAVAESIDGSVFTQDLDRVRLGVESVSWVRSAAVSRIWPQSLSVVVTRHQPAAVYEDGRLVSTEGVLYSTNDLPMEKLIALPAVTGDESYAGAVARGLPGLAEAAREISSTVKSVNVTYRGSWTVTLESEEHPELTVELGRAFSEDVPVARMRRVAKYFLQVSDMMQGYPEKIDARYQDGFAAQIPSVSSNERWTEARGGSVPKPAKGSAPREKI